MGFDPKWMIQLLDPTPLSRKDLLKNRKTDGELIREDFRKSIEHLKSAALETLRRHKITR